MKITLTGSLGNISLPLTQQLIAAGHHVTVVSSSPGRKEDIERIGAAAAIGSVTDTVFLIEAFAGADAIKLGESRLKEFAKEFAAVYNQY